MPNNSEQKSITIRVDMNSSLYAEILKRKEETGKPWATITQEILVEGWSTMVLQNMTRSIIEVNNVKEKDNSEYVLRLEGLLMTFLKSTTHPREGK